MAETMGSNAPSQASVLQMYSETMVARFLSRPNRFIAHVEAEGQVLICHVKNTGRCRELLIPGALVIIARAANSLRKTRYDLVAVYKGDMLVNIDSQAPNAAAHAWLREQYPEAAIKKEALYGHSRLDFHVAGEGQSLYVEVKGCTLEKDGLALFPDAPTERGVKHLNTLLSCIQQGHQGMVLFVIQMRPVRAFSPHDAMHPAFGEALRHAAKNGMQVRAHDCLVHPEGIALHTPVPVIL